MQTDLDLLQDIIDGLQLTVPTEGARLDRTTVAIHEIQTLEAILCMRALLTKIVATLSKGQHHEP